MISLSDSEMAAIIEAARPVGPRENASDVMAELAKYPELGSWHHRPSAPRSSASILWDTMSEASAVTDRRSGEVESS
jgi:hypothetical protein